MYHPSPAHLSPAHVSPADELAEIRAEIARLRAREAALRQVFLNDPYAAATGRWHRVEVVEHCHQIFDVALLSDDIRSDRRYLRNRLVQTLRCLPMSPLPSHRPGWPIRREPASALH